MAAPFVVIFDLNGTLVDTETAHFLGYQEALETEGVHLTLQEFTDHWSRQGKKLDDYLQKIGRQDLVPQYKEIKRRKDNVFQETLAQRIKQMPGAKDVLTLLDTANIPLGLDSSGSGENMEEILAFLHLGHFFRHVANGDTAIDEQKYGDKKWKASRLKYLADQFSVPCDHCIMVGDAEKDIKGAKDAGMRAIAIPNEYTKDNDFSLADARYRSLAELTFASFQELCST